jgi:hypothetical protein
MNYLEHSKHLNNFDAKRHTPFMIDHKQVGSIRDDFMDYIVADPLFEQRDNIITIQDQYTDFASRTQALDQFVQRACADEISSIYMNEPYPVIETPSSAALATVDRGTSSLLGLISFGQHLNGYVEKDGKLWMWIARRSKTKGYAPGKLDHIVAGGLPYGISLADNLRKECHEEAYMEAEIADQAHSIGIITYKREYKQGGKQEIIYCYDIALPESFTPRCNDDEVEEFYLMPIEEVMHIVETTDDFKSNCNLVLIDFFIRHGLIKPDHNDYVALVSGLRQ